MNTTFAQLADDVYTLTNRPDLVKETQLAIKTATLQLHRSDYFYKDIFETAIQFDTLANLQQIDYRTLFPRYRSLVYLRKYDISNVGSAPGKLIKIITPTEVLDDFGAARSDIAYVAGSVIQVKSATAIKYALIGIYQNPVVELESYDSWIEKEAHMAVVFKAASIVFGTTLADTARMQANAQLAQLEMVEVINSNIVAEGY